MKQFLILLIGFSLILTSCSNNNDDDDNDNGNNSKYGCTNPDALNYSSSATVDNGTCILPDDKVRPIVLVYTSTCCHYCGEWGKDTMEYLDKTFKNDIAPIIVHTNLQSCSDPMRNADLETSFKKTFASSGVPSFFIGKYKTPNPEKVNEYLSYSPVAGVAFSATTSGNQINVKTMIEVHDNPQGDKWFGDFFINAYLLESKIDGSPGRGSYDQSGNENDVYWHNYVLRTAATPTSASGSLIVGGEVADNGYHYKDLTLNIDPSWNKSNLHVAVAVWFRATGSYTFVFLNATDNRVVK